MGPVELQWTGSEIGHKSAEALSDCRCMKKHYRRLLAPRNSSQNPQTFELILRNFPENSLNTPTLIFWRWLDCRFWLNLWRIVFCINSNFSRVAWYFAFELINLEVYLGPGEKFRFWCSPEFVRISELNRKVLGFLNIIFYSTRLPSKLQLRLQFINSLACPPKTFAIYKHFIIFRTPL